MLDSHRHRRGPGKEITTVFIKVLLVSLANELYCMYEVMRVEKHRAIPQGYMTVGEVAKKLNTTVFTLQYYDRKNILKPSGKSEGGRRLYTHKDIVKLHQIQSMKYLGFSLEDIKTRLPSIDTPEEVAATLTEQADSIQAKISTLSDVLEATEKLKEEVLQMKTVDWEKYADILVLLQAKHETYWVMKFFDDKLLARAHSIDKEVQASIVNAQKRLLDKASELQINGVAPESEEGQALAKEYWDIVMKFTNGDDALLEELFKLGETHVSSQKDSKQEFLEKALDIYVSKYGS